MQTETAVVRIPAECFKGAVHEGEHKEESIKESGMNEDDIKTTQRLIDFIDRSPSCFHVVANVASRLEGEGFIRLEESKRFSLEQGKSYYVTRNGSSLIAFRIPGLGSEGFSIVSAHTDSPSFKIKGNPEMGEAYTSLNVEGYGGMLMAPWFDRPLSIAGRTFIRDGHGGLQERLVMFDRDLCLIPNLAIHQNREANHGVDYKVQKDLLPLIAQGRKEGALKQMAAQLIGVDEKDLVETELFLYCRMKGTVWGKDNEFFSAPRLDDLQCAYCAVESLIHSGSSRKIQVCALFDNEEVGSGTKQGALSDFLSQTLARIGGSLGWDYEQSCIAKSNSFMLSADNGHAVHPNCPETSDPTSKVYPNKGVVIKHSGNQKYTTDGFSGAVLKDLLERNGIPYQMFFNNSNLPGGSTLGNLSATKYSIPTADIGLAQLAMHSPYETGGVADTRIMMDAMSCFYAEA